MALSFEGLPGPVGDPRRTYHFAGTVTAGQTSEPLFMPRVNRPATVAIHPASSGRVEFTLSSEDDINADNAHWTPWTEGDVTASTASVLAAPVMALRAVAEGGDADWEVMF